jgi:hypothetical protein
MTHESTRQETRFGYLSILEYAEFGYFGGYLIVSHFGRPLEFHCTAPIRPSRAQKILYGATLGPYLLGEQIAGTLLEVAKLKPHLILVDHDATLQARLRSTVPMVLLAEIADRPTDGVQQHETTPEVQAASSSEGGAKWPLRRGTFTVNSCNFQLPVGFESDRDEVSRLLAQLACHIHPVEPFDRIEEAIGEAQRLSGRDAVDHDQAA